LTLRNVVIDLLSFLGIPVENRHQKPGTERAESVSGIATIFERDIQRQRFDHLNKPAPHRDSHGVAEHVNFLRDGAAGPPRRR
jgi:hypothetical protein